MEPVEIYFQELAHIRSSGAAVPETAYYGALERLFNEVGKTLKPKVRCILSLQNHGAGHPDGGFFTLDQFQKSSKTEPLPGQLPSRGVIEVKSTADDAWITAEGKQVSKYWEKYRQVLITNYRDFILLGQDREGNPVKLETFRLAPNEADFWQGTAHPRKMAKDLGERFLEYLKRVMLHAAPLASPKEVAWFLASYARDAKARIEGIELPALSHLRAALEEALGLKFEGEKGEHFFRSSLIQTVFYGIFSAWVLWSKKHPPTSPARFNWREAIWYLHVPMIRALFEQLATPTKLEPLGLVEVLNWTEAALNRIDRSSFFNQFEEGHAVQYFYEPFLQAFDPTLRKDLGSVYTPTEIVQYMVARVDRVLREELAIPDGLADGRVYVLDPCCGTGAFLVEVLKQIAKTLKEKGEDALVGQDVKKAARERVFGFEILPAPFVVAHLQIGLHLQSLGVPLTDEGKERAGVYLSNALTGWEPPQGPKQKLIFPEMEEERDAAEEVKREKPILVILGNPPYNAYAGVSPKEEEGLVEVYKEGLRSKWGILAGSMHDLYIRFFRLAERRIAEMTGQGIICFISNFSYLGEPSFVVMRQRLFSEFDALWFDCMNGDSRETGKITPDGKPDPSVFSTEYNKEGIRVGTAISLLIRKKIRMAEAITRFRHFWGIAKRSDLLESLKAPDLNVEYQSVYPKERNRFSFRPGIVSTDYLEWPKLVDLSSISSYPGMDEDRKFALISVDKEELIDRMKIYFNKNKSWNDIVSCHEGFGTNSHNYNGEKVRKRLLQASKFQENRIMRYVFRPFDIRWCYYEPFAGLWHRVSPKRAQQVFVGNSFLISRPSAKANREGSCIFITSHLSVRDMLIGHGNCIPNLLRFHIAEKHQLGQKNLFGGPEDKAADQKISANLSAAARKYLSVLGLPNPDNDTDTAALIWLHALAIGYSPAYLAENADGIRQDWPRIPLPDKAQVLETSMQLGREIAALLDTESSVPSITTGTVRPEMKTIAVISKMGGGQLNPDAGDLTLKMGWGHGGKGGITMPGKGHAMERDYTSEERQAIREGAAALGLTLEEVLKHLGQTTFDIYLNETAYWRNIPHKVWNYYIGGYQVIKKWLSYREQPLLGRPLSIEEAREVMHMARRLAAIVLMEPALNATYFQVKGSTYPWPRDISEKEDN